MRPNAPLEALIISKLKASQLVAIEEEWEGFSKNSSERACLALLPALGANEITLIKATHIYIIYVVQKIL